MIIRKWNKWNIEILRKVKEEILSSSFETIKK